MSAPEDTQHLPGDTPRPPAAMGEGARSLLTFAAAFIVIYGLKASREVVLPIVLAAFLAIISYPFVVFLRRYLRMPHWMAVTFTVIADGGLIFALIRLLKYLAADVKATLQGNITQLIEERLNACMQWLDQWGIGDHARALIESPGNLIDAQQIISVSQSLTGQVLSFMSVTTLVLILMTFMLGEAPLFVRNFGKLPSSIHGKKKLEKALKGIQKYLLIKTITSVCTGLLTWMLCHIMQVPFAFLWGLVAWLLNYIPTVGSIVAAVPPILLALLLRDWGSMFIVAGGYLAINFAIGNGIEPLFLGKQFGIATSVVLLSVLIWGWIWGPFGMLLAVPFTVLTKLALENSVDLHWVASLIDDNSTTEKKSSPS